MISQQTMNFKRTQPKCKEMREKIPFTKTKCDNIYSFRWHVTENITWNIITSQSQNLRCRCHHRRCWRDRWLDWRSLTEHWQCAVLVQSVVRNPRNHCCCHFERVTRRVRTGGRNTCRRRRCLRRTAADTLRDVSSSWFKAHTMNSPNAS